MQKNKSINELISEMEDHLVASIVFQCREIMKDYPTDTQMTVCYNLICGVFRLFCVRESPENLKKMAQEIHDGLIDQIR